MNYLKQTLGFKVATKESCGRSRCNAMLPGRQSTETSLAPLNFDVGAGLRYPDSGARKPATRGTCRLVLEIRLENKYADILRHTQTLEVLDRKLH